MRAGLRARAHSFVHRKRRHDRHPAPRASADSILIVDFGSQVTQLIARRVREAGVYCEIAPFNPAAAAFERMKPKGIILSGSPAGVPEEGSPRAPQELFDSGASDPRHLLRPAGDEPPARRDGSAARASGTASSAAPSSP